MDSDHLNPNEKMINSEELEAITFLPLSKLRYSVLGEDLAPAFLISARTKTDLPRQVIKSTCVCFKTLLRAIAFIET